MRLLAKFDLCFQISLLFFCVCVCLDHEGFRFERGLCKMLFSSCVAL